MKRGSRILVFGATGMVGSSIVRELGRQQFQNILAPSRSEIDLREQEQVRRYFAQHRPDYVFMAAAKVGGILANDRFRADALWENLAIQNNVFEAAYKHPVRRLLFLGSSCIYPKACTQPIKEEYLLSGPLEATNEPYAIAKIAGLKLAENFRRQYNCPFFSVMPCNLYGENDNFHPEHSHVIPGLVARLDTAITNNDRTFTYWGSGKPRREFLYVDDLSAACLFLMRYEGALPDWINVGAGTDISIARLVTLIAEKMGFTGSIINDLSYPDGTMQKLMDSSKIRALGWAPSTSLDEGLDKAIAFYRQKARAA